MKLVGVGVGTVLSPTLNGSWIREERVRMKGMNFYYVDKAWGEILCKLKLFRKGVNVLEGSGKNVKW